MRLRIVTEIDPAGETQPSHLEWRPQWCPVWLRIKLPYMRFKTPNEAITFLKNGTCPTHNDTGSSSTHPCEKGST